MAQRAEGTFTWALANGTPPPHIIHAALHVADQIDRQGSPVPAARHGYRHYPSGGVFPPDDLRRGERLLVESGLVREEAGVLYPTQELSSLVATPQHEATELLLARALKITLPAWLEQSVSPPPDVMSVIEELVPDPDKREAFLLLIRGRYDSSATAALGAKGEEEVAARAREELLDLGRPDLASRVQRVSLISDRLGYDIVAPKLDQRTRRLEVKTTARTPDGAIDCYVTRNEIEAGRRDPGWALVICKLEPDDRVVVVGWCRVTAVEPYLPIDSAGGTWREAELTIPRMLLVPGIPAAF